MFRVYLKYDFFKSTINKTNSKKDFWVRLFINLALIQEITKSRKKIFFSTKSLPDG